MNREDKNTLITLGIIGGIGLLGWLLSRDKYKCPRCNYPVAKESYQCPNCGQPLEWEVR